VLLFALAAAPAYAVDCNIPSIPNFRRTNILGGATIALAWDSPAPNTTPTYEIVQQTKSDYCSTSLGAETVVGTTTNTSFTYTMTPSNVAAVVFVRLAIEHCARSPVIVADSFTSLPAKPPPPVVSASGAIAVNYTDPRSLQVTLQRAGADDLNFITLGFRDNCTAGNPKTFFDTVAPGIYRYRVAVGNAAGIIASDIVTATIGTNVPLRVRAFASSPSTIALGDAASIATLAWVTEGAESVTIQPFPGGGTGEVRAAGTFGVKPATTTTYTLTAKQGTQTVTATTTVNVLSLPFLNITKTIDPIIQFTNTGGSSTQFAVKNVGGQSTTVNLTQEGSVVTQSPSTFTLDAGAMQVITITGTPQPRGFYNIRAELTYTSGAGGNLSRISYGMQLLSTDAPTGSVTADPSQVRVDVQADRGSNPTGNVTFTNNGTAALVGLLGSDVGWIVPQSGSVTIQPRQQGTFTFAIDRSKRPDGSAPLGSLAGHLILKFLRGPGGTTLAAKPFDTTTTIPSVSLVKVVDTVSTTVTTSGVPTLGTNEVALFVPGVGHTTTSSGTIFVSDVSMLNPQGSASIDDVKMYYTPLTGTASSSKTTSIGSVPGQTNVEVADVVKSVFSGTNEVGTLHIRSKDADKLAVAATSLATNNPTGTLGSSIPVLRSDRAVAANSSLILTGLRKDATTHTDLYIQETAGLPVSYTIEFLAADGSTIASRAVESLEAFKLRQLKDIVPANAVAAVITNTSAPGGKLSGYATPVDDANGDTWALGDWSTQLGYASSNAVVIPIAGTVHGANDTFYRSDVAITNRESATATGTLAFVGRDGSRTERSISLGGKQTSIMNDVIASKFGIAGDAMGYLRFTPVTGNFAITSRTYATVGSKTATLSTGVPVIAAAAALKQGAVRPIAGLDDADRSTVVDAKAGTFRTNFAVMETSGLPVTVRVTFRFTFPAGDKVQGTGIAYRDYPLNGNQFMLLNSIAGEVLGSARLRYGDLQNVEADFTVLDGDGAVMLFTSSVDNASGDSILRIE
jgi:hypothetical protein